VNGGFYAFSRAFVDELDDDPELMLEQEPMHGLAQRGELMMWAHDGFWAGMDTYRDYLELNRMWDEGSAPWKMWD
jgi:glucose-1-phosphate cytidylyltransferase